MSEENWVGLIVAVSLVGYLVAAVMRPGKFCTSPGEVPQPTAARAGVPG